MSRLYKRLSAGRLTLSFFTAHPAKPQEAAALVGLVIAISFRRRTTPTILTRTEVTHVLRVVADCCNPTDGFFGFWIAVRFLAQGTLHKTSGDKNESIERLHGLIKWVFVDTLYCSLVLGNEQAGHWDHTCSWYGGNWSFVLNSNKDSD